jgi:tetratricopeptide (TPR) repeat protein
MVDNIIEEIKKGLNGDKFHDVKYLQHQAVVYKDHEQATEILRIISEMIFDLVPDDKKDVLKKSMFIKGMRLDEAFGRANTLVKEKRTEAAAELLGEIEKHADEYFSDTDEKLRLSLRNPLDEYIYMQIFKPEKAHERTPFDFSRYLSAYGYLLVELRRCDEAVPVLEKAIHYNPVNVEPRFELAEAYKVMLEPDKLFDCVVQTLKVARTPYEIARCYCNLGFYCIEIKDYDSAVCFYYESLLYAPNEAVTGELHHISSITKKKIAPPLREEVLAAFKKYDVPNGPNPDVYNVAYSLAQYCIDKNAGPEEILYYLRVTYDLTHNPEVKEQMDKYEAKVKELKEAEEK